MCYALRYDSVFGRLDAAIELTPSVAGDHAIMINKVRVQLLDSRTPEELDWKGAGAKYVVESTGAFTTSKAARGHLGKKGGGRAIITAPAKDDTPVTCME